MNISVLLSDLFKVAASRRLFSIDWLLFFALIPLLGAGLVTMNSFVGENDFFKKQLIWIALALITFFALSFLDVRFLRRTSVLVTLFLLVSAMLVFLFAMGSVFKGAQSWFNLGWFALQPSEPAKLILILMLAKYFSRRHVEIAHVQHIIVSGIYVAVLGGLVFLQPDFGSAIIMGLIWFGMVLTSGISKKHLLLVFLIGLASFSILWFYLFKEYQRERVLTFLNPLSDVRGAGYNAYQSMIAVGSGGLLGKGIGYGTQSRLQFLPEYETDFMFAAFAEEWGLLGVIILFLLFGVIFWRILVASFQGATNFEILFGIGLVVLLMSQFFIHIGMNIGLLPVTGITIPFLSYGGSHLITEFAGLGILMAMRRYSRGIHREDMSKEFLGI